MPKEPYHQVLWNQFIEATQGLYFAGYNTDEMVQKVHDVINEALEEDEDA